MANCCSQRNLPIAWLPTVAAYRLPNKKSTYPKSLQRVHRPAHLEAAAVNTMKDLIIKYKKPIIITLSVTVLQLIFGFDPKFTLINIIWLFV